MDSALKQRLLGAAVLVALAVVFVPMFFSGTSPKVQNATQTLNIPPAPERNFETRNLAVDTHAPTPAAPAPQAGEGRLATVDTSAAAGAEASSRPAPTAPPAAAKPADAPPPAPPAAGPPGRFLVNLGVYADAANASALVERMKKLGYPAFAESVDLDGKPAQRVRVGPYEDRAAAEGARLKIKQADAKLAGTLVRLADADAPAPGNGPKPPATAPTPTLPANRAGGYAVQVGAFKSEDEANRLRDRLRNGGVAAFIDKAPGEGGQTFWKVRTGPYADKGSAEAAVASLKQKFQINGMVRTQP